MENGILAQKFIHCYGNSYNELILTFGISTTTSKLPVANIFVVSIIFLNLINDSNQM